jgi:simple sugar transport system ATP-binding protein
MEEEIARCSKEFHLDVDPSAKIWQMSVGEQQRVEIIKLLYRGADILILDEPSAVLTAQEAVEMFKNLRKMAESGKSVVVISHKMSEVMQFADRITVLKGGKVEDTMPASEATVERLTKAVVGDREFKPQKNEGSAKTDKIVLEINDVTVKNDKGLQAVKNLSLDIHAGEIFGIAGVAGNGQKELAEVIVGLRKAETGAIILNGEDITKLSVKQRIQKKIAFIPEDRLSMGLVPGMTMDENRILKQYGEKQFSKNGILNKKAISDAVDAEIERHEIKIVGKSAPVSLMSGGNQQKLIIAREISGDPKLIICAYPSRGLDMGAAEAVRQILLEQCKKGVAVLMVSEELDELFQMADRIGVMCDGEMMAILDSDKTDYDTVGRLMSGERYE